jgi:nucleoside-diphosphate-sugar epimerase
MVPITGTEDTSSGNHAMPDKKILITGHSGFVGQALCRTLDRLEGVSWSGASRKTGTDLSQADALSNFGRHQTIVHLAGKVGVPPSWEDPESFYRQNFDFTLHALEFARKHEASMIYVSSYMYGDPEYLPIDENHPIKCNNPYAWSKRLGEILCEAYATNHSLPVSIIRVFNLFGEDQPEGQLVKSVINQALTSDEVTLDILTSRRDFLWIGDLAEALSQVIQQPKTGYNVYNLGSGKSTSNLEVIQAVLDIIGPRKIVDAKRPRPNEISDSVCDNRLFCETFSWHPQMSFEKGIEILVERTKKSMENSEAV